jgi:hypothetical protein
MTYPNFSCAYSSFFAMSFFGFIYKKWVKPVEE